MYTFSKNIEFILEVILTCCVYVGIFLCTSFFGPTNSGFPFENYLDAWKESARVWVSLFHMPVKASDLIGNQQDCEIVNNYQRQILCCPQRRAMK